MDKSHASAQTGLSTMKRDYADEVYIAANLAEKGCTSELIVDRPFLVIGDYTYTMDEWGSLFMFPYGPGYNVQPGQAITNRTYWNYGVELDEQFALDCPDLFDIGGGNGHPGFPLSRIVRLVSDIIDMAEVMDAYDINTVTG